jgi:hypothetical protein
MALEAVPANDRWREYTFDVLSTATFVQGSFVKFDGSRRVVEMTSLVTDLAILGVSTASSTNSLPSGKCVISVPIYGATVRVPTGGIAQSSLSLGQAVQFTKSGNTFSGITTSKVTQHGNVVSPLRSGDSTIEVAILANAMQFFSTATMAI